MLHTFPDAAEITEAVRDFLLTKVLPVTEGTLSFHVRVAANLISVLEREMTGPAGVERWYRGAIRKYGADDEAGLALKLRTGEVIYDAELGHILRLATAARLHVSNPDYLELEDASLLERHIAHVEDKQCEC